MALRAVLVVLIMGLPAIHFIQSVQHPVAREPQMMEFSSHIASPSEGAYYLVNGTDACSGKINVRNHCGGLMVSVGPDQEYAFCAINKTASVSINREGASLRKTTVEVKQEGQMVQRKETITYSNKDESLSLVNDDTLMFNQDNQLLWEHSRNAHGFSCLYSK